jgi:hypothetical protein
LAKKQPAAKVLIMPHNALNNNIVQNHKKKISKKNADFFKNGAKKFV